MLMTQGKVVEQRTSGLAAYLRVTTILRLQHWGKEGVEKVRKTCDVKPAGRSGCFRYYNNRCEVISVH